MFYLHARQAEMDEFTLLEQEDIIGTFVGWLIVIGLGVAYLSIFAILICVAIRKKEFIDKKIMSLAAWIEFTLIVTGLAVIVPWYVYTMFMVVLNMVIDGVTYEPLEFIVFILFMSLFFRYLHQKAQKEKARR